MASLPFAFSAHVSAWRSSNAEEGRGAGVVRSSENVACRLCGQGTHGWQEVYHLNDDHDDRGVSNLVHVCPLCHLPQHLNRPLIDEEARLVWLPELTQRALIVLVREAHLALVRSNLPPDADSLPNRVVEPGAKAALATLRALRARSAPAVARLGTSLPSVLGAALLSLAHAVYQDRARRLDGVRLLPSGRLHQRGHDVYPDILADWAGPNVGASAPC